MLAKNKTVEIFVLENGIYGEPKIFSKDDIMQSEIFNEINIPLLEIFD